ncbi:DUF3696 domain-containing protein [Aliarcobacter butzleri]|nr:DUF3696 domain-containing protein [Aliarcobacter butzleri]
MTKINKISIQNFKILKNIEDIELGNLNLITGINSSGKSTFIQSLLLLKENKDLINQLLTNKIMLQNIDEQPTSMIEHIKRNLENKKKQTISFEGEYIDLGDRIDIFNQDIYEEDIQIDIYTSSEDLGKLETKIEYKNGYLDVNFKFPFLDLINLFSDDFQYINTNRIQPSRIYNLSQKHIKKGLLGINGEFTAHYLDENRRKKLNINALKHNNSQTDMLLENVSCWLSEISEGIEVVPQRHQDIHQASLSYKYTYGENITNELNPLNVGFGLTYILPVIVAILKSKPNDLLIIENPESHLHPAGQSKIAKLCALASSNGVQLIIESHSDHFLNGIRVATKDQLISPDMTKIYYFEKEINEMSSKIHSLSIDKDGKINEAWPKGFFDEYDKLLDELIEW